MRPIQLIEHERASLLPYTALDELQMAVTGNYLLGIAAVEWPLHLFSS